MGGSALEAGQTLGVPRFRPRAQAVSVVEVPSYLVESPVTSAPEAFDDACRQAQRVCDQGTGIKCVRTTFLPGDETVMHVFEAPSLQALADAGRVAGLRFERIVQWSDDLTNDDREE